jgi:hypothetical protein
MARNNIVSTITGDSTNNKSNPMSRSAIGLINFLYNFYYF